MIIYKIKNRLNGRIYVGQTRRPLKERIAEHMRQSRRKSYIDRAIKKHGIKNFEISILEECSSIEEMNEREKFWIKELNCKVPNGYNITDGGLGRIVTDEEKANKSKAQKGHSVSEETRRKISIANTGKTHVVTDEIRKYMSVRSAVKRPVRCLETDEIFESVTAAAKWAGVARGTIRAACRKNTRTGGGYHWKYEDKKILLIQKISKILQRVCNNVQSKSLNESKFEKIYTDLKTKIKTFEYDFNSFVPSEYELVKIYDCSRSTVRRALAELVKRGYVQVRQGSRVRVIYEPVERNVFKIGGIESFKEAAIRNGFSYDTKVVKLEKIFANAEISERTGFKIGDEIFDVRRIRYVNGKALIFDKNYFLTSAVKNLTEEIAKSSIYEYLENELKMKIMTSKRKMTTELATSEDKKYLELGDYNCLAIVSGRVFNSDGIQFEYTESRHRPDYFCFEDTATRHKFNG